MRFIRLSIIWNEFPAKRNISTSNSGPDSQNAAQIKIQFVSRGFPDPIFRRYRCTIYGSGGVILTVQKAQKAYSLAMNFNQRGNTFLKKERPLETAEQQRRNQDIKKNFDLILKKQMQK